MHDEYSTKQPARDAEYEREYSAWMATKSPEEVTDLKSKGIDVPMTDFHGSGSLWMDGSDLPARDIADSSVASFTPDFAAIIDGEPTEPEARDPCDISDALRHVIAFLQSKENTLMVDCFAFVTNLSSYDGETQTEIAKRHGMTRAAVSKVCIGICEEFNLRPPPGMHSEKTRDACRRAQLTKNHTL